MALLQSLLRVPSLALLAIAFVAWRISRRYSSWNSLPLPPGPQGEPIFGHLRIVPTDNPEYAYQKWSEAYKSDVLYFNILGQDVVVLNSVQAAADLLDKRGANYCDRPRFWLFEVMGWRMTLTFLRWGPHFRMHRKVLQKAFQKSNIIQFRSLQERETRVLLRGIIEQPHGWELAMRRFATAIVLGIGFGIHIKTDDDPFIQMAVDASYALGNGGAPGGTLVDFFPFIRHLPNFLARSSASLKFAQDWRWAIRQIHDAPFSAVQASTEPKSGQSSLIRALLDQREARLASNQPEEMTIEDIKGAAGAVYAAGQDTTWSTLIVLVLNMVLHPGVQRKAQAELDLVLGPGPSRLPTFADRPQLPYLDLIVQETLRWCPVSPVGVPHRALAKDEYNGMRIPAGTIVYANARAMTHDPRTYCDPDTFDPDRFLRGEPLPVGHFGFGRRICVGKHLAEASIWIVAASLLATMDIVKECGPDDVEITPEVRLTNGLTSHPRSFPCRFVPRSCAARDLALTAAS